MQEIRLLKSEINTSLGILSLQIDTAFSEIERDQRNLERQITRAKKILDVYKTVKR